MVADYTFTTLAYFITDVLRTDNIPLPFGQMDDIDSNCFVFHIQFAVKMTKFSVMLAAIVLSRAIRQRLNMPCFHRLHALSMELHCQCFNYIVGIVDRIALMESA